MTSAFEATPKIGNSALRQLPPVEDDRDIPPLPSLVPNVEAVAEEEEPQPKEENNVTKTNEDDLLGQLPTTSNGMSVDTTSTNGGATTSFFSWFTSSTSNDAAEEAIAKDLEEAVAAAIEEEETNVPMEEVPPAESVATLSEPSLPIAPANTSDDAVDIPSVQPKVAEEMNLPLNQEGAEKENTSSIPSTDVATEVSVPLESTNGDVGTIVTAATEEEEEFVVLPTNEPVVQNTAEDGTEAPPPPPSSTDAAPWRVVRSRSHLADPPTALAILRKFCTQTRPGIWKQYGGTLSKSFWSYLFASSSQYNEQSTFAPYATLWGMLQETEGASPEQITEEHAFAALAAFVHLFGIWGHASSAWSDPHKHDAKHRAIFLSLQVAILHAAGQLVTHGCLDHLYVTTDGVEDTQGTAAAQILATSVFNTDLTVDRVELAALQFLLSTGLRPVTLLRGSYLLQTIRTLYHVYLTTETKNNRVAARAALQQLVTSVFTKVVQEKAPISDLAFPTENHRDAFLVLRSLCKLSMRSLPDDPSMHSHIGLQTSASHDTWDADRWNGTSSLPGGDRPLTQDSQNSASSAAPARKAQLISTGALHPALESKLLALELILYILQHVDFETHDFIHTCGSQFHVAIRNYLCVSLLKNCTSGNAHIVSWSLRIFVPVVHHFRTVLKTEIEAFVTNVFFVILDSQHSPAEHKSIVVRTFQEICSDPNTLAEIFLNYDCDLSAVDLFHRIVQTLSRLSRSGLQPTPRSSLMGPSEAILEKQRNESRDLRLEAMRALRQILASLHASIVEPMSSSHYPSAEEESTPASAETATEPSLVDIYDSKKKRRAEEAEAIIRFNQKPSAGIAYAAKCGHLMADDPADVARYLLQHKDDFDKAMIGEYLGREVDYQNGFSIRVLHEYVRLLDFSNLVFDDAIRYFLSGFRLPGEAQKIDRIMEKFAERFTEQNPQVFPTADAAFILSFSIIMLNTDLHNPAIKEDRRMTKEGFIRNNRGICDGQDLPEDMLTAIFDRIKQNPISLKEDDEARERAGESKKKSAGGLPAALNPASFFSSHYNDADRARETQFQKERDHIVRTTESLLKRRRHVADTKSPSKFRTARSHRNQSRYVRSGDSGLRDEYVSPMFEVTWGPALAAFSTAMESANGTAGTLISIASDEELERAAENAAETIEVCLTGFRLAIGTAGLCGNPIARDAYMLALSRFSQLGTGILLEPRHIRCIQTMFSLAKEDGELLGNSWEHVFRALSEVNRFHQVFQLMARNDRAAAVAAERRLRRLEILEQKRRARDERKAAAEDGESLGDANDYDDTDTEDDNDSLAESGLFTDDDEFDLEENMDAKAIDEANARAVYDAVSEATIEAIYERSSSLSSTAVMEFVVQLCLVSRAEIAVGTNSRPGDLNQVTYRQKHARVSGDQFHHTQPNIYNLQKLVEVTHYNMASRPRLLFSDIWIIVADHLTYTALHSNPAVAMYAVDSFRQLSIQYLQRDELEVFEFQRRFLKPLEIVMAMSQQTSTKELLLNCVGRLMHVFGTGSSEKESSSIRKGGLRSGWVPILTILGIGGCDTDAGIAETSFKALSDEIHLCLEDSIHPDVLLAEHFVDTVNALLKMNESPHSNISIQAVDQLVKLTDALAEGKIAPAQNRRKLQSSSSNLLAETSNEDESSQHLELWWPILLGLSRGVGDGRIEVRAKSLEVLFGMINKHFFPSEQGDDTASPFETIQLIFRGILNSVLEFAESSTDTGPAPSLPMDFERVVVDSKDDKTVSETRTDDPASSTWLETTFDAFMDSCIGLCVRSLSDSTESVLVEEIFALLNSCLLSDSGALAVKGLLRLEQFVTSDLNPTTLSDDVWATVSHMLQRCLTVRGLPKKPTVQEGASEEDVKELDMEYAQSIKDFVAEDLMLPYRRYVGSNATMVVGFLLCNSRFSVGLRWRLFLIKWLHRGIREWDAAALFLSSVEGTKPRMNMSSPPDYRETAVYGRKWINRLVLQLVAMPEIVQAPANVDPKSNRFAQGQKLVIELTEGLLMSYLQAEEAALTYRHTELNEIWHKRYNDLVVEFLIGLGTMEDDHLKQMSWMSPVLLSSCIRSKSETIRGMVQTLVARTSPAPTPTAPYPSPQAPPQPTIPPPPTPPSVEESASDSVPTTQESSEAATPVAQDV